MSEQVATNKQDFFSVQDIVIEPLQLPAPYKGSVFVRTMTGEEWDSYQEAIYVADETGERKVDFKGIRVNIIVRTVCDAEGNLLFTTDDIPALKKKGSKVLEIMAAAAQKLNGVGEDSSKKA